jgi:hypothetical protein
MEYSNIKQGLGKTRPLSLLWYAVILGISGFALSSCSTQRAIRLRNKSIKEWSAYQWGEVKKSSDNDAKEWSVYSRKVKGTTSLEYKIEGNINSTPEACLAAFKQDLHQQADGSMEKKYPIYDIKEESEKGLLTYVVHNEPFIFKDTEMSVRYLFFNQEDGSTEVKWREAWEDCPIQASKKLNRIESFRGSWNFTPLVNNSSQGVKTVQFDPKKMPRWLFEPMVLKFLKDGLKEIAEIASASSEEITSQNQ